MRCVGFRNGLQMQLYAKRVVGLLWVGTRILWMCNDPMERRHLWADLEFHKNVVCGSPWALLGDFNVALNMEDSFIGTSNMNSAMCEFKDCIENIEVFDINSSGLHFTWNQKPKGSGGILKKLDRIMGNIDFVDVFPGNLHERVKRLQIELDEVQKALDLDPSNGVLRDEEATYVQAFNKAKIDEELFLRQKAKIDWLEVGDSNSAYFHKTIKTRNQRSRIDVITTVDNVEVSGNLVQDVFVSHYQSFLGTNLVCDDLDTMGLFDKKVSELSNENMTRPVTNEEIKKAMFGIGDDKAPGPDGYTSTFFKKVWDVVGQEVCNAVHDFFANGKILKETNHTFIALIPKVTTPLKVNDYRPISCCNVIYKCISKILTNRIIDGIKEVVSENQSAFVPGRRISDNILITQELMHNYHMDRGPPHCAFKVDIQKAYDIVVMMVE
ncbi:protein LAZ1 [Tanacetum coccineum]